MKVQLLTVEQVAQQLQLTDRHVRHLAREGDLPSIRLGHYWRFDQRRIDEVLAGGGTRKS